MKYPIDVTMPGIALALVCAMSACSSKTASGPDTALVKPAAAAATDQTPQTESTPASTGTVADMMGPDWKLESYDASDPVPADINITLAVNVDRLSGQGGCNRYMGSISNGDGPGKLVIGPMALTRMACAPPTDAAEMRYMAALQRANAFSVHGRKLTLTYADGDATRTLTYAR